MSSHRGSSFDAFLREDGILEEVDALAREAVREYESGETMSLEDFAAQERIHIPDDTDMGDGVES